MSNVVFLENGRYHWNCQNRSFVLPSNANTLNNFLSNLFLCVKLDRRSYLCEEFSLRVLLNIGTGIDNVAVACYFHICFQFK